MKLSELQPKWYATAGRHGQGISFLCPHCRDVRLGVAFDRPLDGGEPIQLQKRESYEALNQVPGVTSVPPGVHWTREGDTFETLTLSPSVDCSRSGHWHGWIRNGEATL